MINRLTNNFALTVAQLTLLDDMVPFDSDDWDSGVNLIVAIRERIGVQLRDFQNGKCCYCGLLYDETGRSEIEHIAPKNARVQDYPEFSFTETNLAIACQQCNSSSMKGEYDPILNYSPNYQDCTFSIVHPYHDRPSQHYSWSNGPIRVLITGRSLEGRESIRLFKLDGEARTMARAKQRIFERILNLANLTQNSLERIKKVMNFRPFS